MEVKAGDSGKFTCIARTESGQSLQHTTRLTSFPPPVFAHPPIWNQVGSTCSTSLMRP